MAKSPPLDLDVDLEFGVIPISKAASALAALLKRARSQQQPIIVTQKGYPTGVLLDIDLYVALRARAMRATHPAEATDELSAESSVPESGPAPVPDDTAPPKRRGGRRRRTEEPQP
jgi:prevent-host-death family protein